jgi:hypothetical protein
MVLSQAEAVKPRAALQRPLVLVVQVNVQAVSLAKAPQVEVPAARARADKARVPVLTVTPI